MKRTSDCNLSIIVCTYNRGEILKECIDSVIDIKANDDGVELLIVNNNSTDNTSSVAELYSQKYNWIHHVIEKKQGLSNARNCGAEAAKSNWCLYLDDDALVEGNFIKKALELVGQSKYQCVGGLYLPWYKYGKPNWYRDSFASNKKPYNQLTVLKEGENVSGGVLLINRNTLFEVGLFSDKFGMTGDKVAYGEEDYLQHKLRKQGHQIAYDPTLIIFHLVPQYKLNVRWFLKSSFEKGKIFLPVKGYPVNILTVSIAFFIAVTQILFSAVINLPRLVFKGYYKQNYILDTFKKPLKWFGVVSSYRQNNETNNR